MNKKIRKNLLDLEYQRTLNNSNIIYLAVVTFLIAILFFKFDKEINLLIKAYAIMVFIIIISIIKYIYDEKFNLQAEKSPCESWEMKG
ncbi:MAG: hypothetical protein KKG75_05355 [Nanoarchaeota archaeon]|nr:hypothetical protein [Nanoarchaeota archaeon]